MDTGNKIKKDNLNSDLRGNDILFKHNGIIFSYRVGGALIVNGKILLCKGGNDYSLPGGHVSIGEESKETIVREFKEETNLDVEVTNVISTFENFWMWGENPCHQICIFYKLKLLNSVDEAIYHPDTKKIELVWVDLSKIKDLDIYPSGLKDFIINDSSDNNHLISRDKNYKEK